jgi:CheY-like chemotaxis protein
MRPAGRILVVDDDSMFRDLYRDLLSRDGTWSRPLQPEKRRWCGWTRMTGPW